MRLPSSEEMERNHTTLEGLVETIAAEATELGWDIIIIIIIVFICIAPYLRN